LSRVSRFVAIAAMGIDGSVSGTSGDKIEA
jgi:hypothetical protein